MRSRLRMTRTTRLAEVADVSVRFGGSRRSTASASRSTAASLRPDRPERGRQDHALQLHHPLLRHRGGSVRIGGDRVDRLRRERHLGGHRAHVPEHRPLSGDDRHRERAAGRTSSVRRHASRGLLPPADGGGQGNEAHAWCRSVLQDLGLESLPTSRPPRCPMGRSSASKSRGRWRRSRGCCCSTSRQEASPMARSPSSATSCAASATATA